MLAIGIILVGFGIVVPTIYWVLTGVGMIFGVVITVKVIEEIKDERAFIVFSKLRSLFIFCFNITIYCLLSFKAFEGFTPYLWFHVYFGCAIAMGVANMVSKSR